MESTQNFHQSGLTRPVLADQGDDFAGINGEINMIRAITPGNLLETPFTSTIGGSRYDKENVFFPR